MWYPLKFVPLFKERVWGGRRLQTLYGKALPPGSTIGESWEIVDRPEAVSVIANGALAGRDLRWLLQNYGRDIGGVGGPAEGQHRFPLLIKILDATDRLSLQVHPPAAVARALGGEPKTEMWYVAQADPGAELYVGLRPGVDQRRFEECLARSSVAECFHRLQVRAGDVMFLPSGRVHAIGAGLVIFEVQQNSDTTYRVYDWDRVGLDGRPRDLHLAESLRSIDWTDVRPGLVDYDRAVASQPRAVPLVADPLFDVSIWSAPGGSFTFDRTPGVELIGVVEGSLSFRGDFGGEVHFDAGEFGLLPAALGELKCSLVEPARCLRIKPGNRRCLSEPNGPE